ncbi:MAG: bifunctional phosphoglucose/phosphomannose isomerase [Anaerolineae bacterium]|nr:bifunctional phosphoglucose/phosphomannose isomerase [Anaerolineae bacterium]MDW8103101.1 bifunctional phosphoglucose/phosphomannose isomerase [Anaerolineae bacterium]
MFLLDSPSAWSQWDQANMLEQIFGLPEQCRKAWEDAQRQSLPADYRGAKSVLILGMGGSAIGGDLVAALARYESPCPIVVCRDYRIPSWAGPETLVIASSYSGNTEETLAAFDQALEARARCVAVTTGGKLASLAQERGVPLWPITYIGQPRSAIGYSVLYLLRILEEAGLMGNKTEEVEKAIRLMENLRERIKPEVPTDSNPAKKLALDLYGAIPVIYGPGFLAAVARRWKGQFNENSKNWSFYEELPEAHHNAVVGYPNPSESKNKFVVIVLDSSLEHPRHEARLRITEEVLAMEGIPQRSVKIEGSTFLEQIFWSIHFGDFVSYYLALLNRADPSSVEVISYIKRRLAG